MEDLPLSGEPLRARIKEVGLNLSMVADALGIRPQAVQRWASGNGLPSAKYIPQLAKLLQLELETDADNERLMRVEDAISQLQGDVTEIAALLRQLVRQQLDAAAAEPATPTVQRRKKSR
jgi:transcriptional regulator with XRE-family HTH domain